MAEPSDPPPEDRSAPPSQRRPWWQRVLGGPGPGDLRPPAAVTGALAAGAERRGWALLEEDPALAGLLAGAPLRLTAEHRAAPVVRGRAGTWDVVACEVRYLMPRGDLSYPQYAVTALPVPLPLPVLRIAPRRFLSHGGAGLLVVPTGDEEFDGRWRVLAGQDTPEVRGLVGAELQAALLAGPDVDELWTADGHLAVSRAGGYHDALLDEHTALLKAAMNGLQRAL